MLYEYEFIIDGAPYSALFADFSEVKQFISENRAEGSKVRIKSHRKVTAKEVARDNCYSWDYRVEMLASILLPNHKDFHKVVELEAEMQRLGLFDNL